MAKLLRDMLLIGLISLAGAEVGLRLFFADMLVLPSKPQLNTAENLFWKQDAQLGWTHQINVQGKFMIDHAVGHIHLGEHGERLNAPNSTFRPDYQNIFFIGDSTTVSFEVDDAMTVPALLETRLRRAGRHVNVINLGVRGYGTDQSVRRALKLAGIFQPIEIIYMYTDNDMFNNNVLRQGRRKFGKGVYLSNTENEFHTFNYPVPEYEPDYAGLVMFDDNCRPIIYQTRLLPENANKRHDQPLTTVRQIKDFLNHSFYSYRALAHIRQGVEARIRALGSGGEVHNRKNVKDHAWLLHMDRSKMDICSLIKSDGVQWSDRFAYSYMEGGYYRKQCSGYLERQFVFLVKKLRNISSVKRIYLVEFPSEQAGLVQVRKGNVRANHQLFQHMKQSGIIDSYLDLYQAMVDDGVKRHDLSCEGDPHFCESGNQWIAKALIRHLRQHNFATVTDERLEN